MMKIPKKVLVFLGPPGSGKGTQAKKVAEKYAFKHISTGDVLRNLNKSVEPPTPETEAILALMEKGELVPDNTIVSLTQRYINHFVRPDQGMVLDGAIRNVEQAKAMQEFFKNTNRLDQVAVLNFEITDDESFNRLAKRKVCPVCGYIAVGVEEKLAHCPKCNNLLGVRSDDTPEVISKRIETQGNKALKSIREFYHQQAGVNFKTINGMQPVDQVEKEIEQVICS